MDEIRLVKNTHAEITEKGTFPDFSEETLQKVRAFHKSFPQYRETPLAVLSNTAELLGLGAFYVKDESFRFGLNAFKVLGGSFAIGSILSEKLGKDISELPYGVITGPDFCAVLEKAGVSGLEFVTATDGNHGRGVAWAAHELGFRSHVYMPEGSARERLLNIRKAGAEAEITAMNYDDTVRFAKKQAEEHGWMLVQDTSWDGYETVPLSIMQGYGTMASEILRQLPDRPTHLFLQAGVGSMAAAQAAFFCEALGAERPKIIIAEPDRADCFYRTAAADDGTLHAVTGRMDTIMAGLACGEPCTLAWDILKRTADFFVSFPDYAAADGMRLLGNPAKGDPAVVSGESGASTAGLVYHLMTDPDFADAKAQIGLDAASRVLCISTEGDTYRENYRRIVWNGAYRKGVSGDGSV